MQKIKKKFFSKSFNTYSFSFLFFFEKWRDKYTKYSKLLQAISWVKYKNLNHMYNHQHCKGNCLGAYVPECYLFLLSTRAATCSNASRALDGSSSFNSSMAAALCASANSLVWYTPSLWEKKIVFFIKHELQIS